MRSLSVQVSLVAAAVPNVAAAAVVCTSGTTSQPLLRAASLVVLR
jgi:hypothetical protein